MTAYPIGFEVSCDGPDEETDCPNSAAVSASFMSRTAREVRVDGRADGWTAWRGQGRLWDACPACTAARGTRTAAAGTKGKTVPLTDCFWIERTKCGCVVSVVTAVCEGNWMLATEEQAREHFEPNPRAREESVRDGRRTELITMAYYDEHLRRGPWECVQHRKLVAS